ncbi:hypothetical protein ACET3Z_023054 [Daucus carota]
MQQKVVIKVAMCSPQKSRVKAMKIAATSYGVEAVALKGDDKDEIEVIGEGIDTIELAKALRKYVGRADVQKVVIRVDMSDPKKSRAKAMKIAATFSGVESVAIKGDDKDKLEVIGEEIDTVVLARLLRKSVGRADLISIGPVKDDKKDKKDEVKIKPKLQVYGSNYPHNYYYCEPVPSYQHVYETRDSYNDPNCSIM